MRLDLPTKSPANDDDEQELSAVALATVEGCSDDNISTSTSTSNGVEHLSLSLSYAKN
jgi:hypothetical protein